MQRNYKIAISCSSSFCKLKICRDDEMEKKLQRWVIGNSVELILRSPVGWLNGFQRNEMDGIAWIQMLRWFEKSEMISSATNSPSHNRPTYCFVELNFRFVCQTKCGNKVPPLSSVQSKFQSSVVIETQHKTRSTSFYSNPALSFSGRNWVVQMQLWSPPETCPLREFFRHTALALTPWAPLVPEWFTGVLIKKAFGKSSGHFIIPEDLFNLRLTPLLVESLHYDVNVIQVLEFFTNYWPFTVKVQEVAEYSMVFRELKSEFHWKN